MSDLNLEDLITTPDVILETAESGTPNSMSLNMASDAVTIDPRTASASSISGETPSGAGVSGDAPGGSNSTRTSSEKEKTKRGKQRCQKCRPDAQGNLPYRVDCWIHKKGDRRRATTDGTELEQLAVTDEVESRDLNASVDWEVKREDSPREGRRLPGNEELEGDQPQKKVKTKSWSSASSAVPHFYHPQSNDGKSPLLDSHWSETELHQIWSSYPAAVQLIKRDSSRAFISDSQMRKEYIHKSCWRFQREVVTFSERTGVGIVLAIGGLDGVFDSGCKGSLQSQHGSWTIASPNLVHNPLASRMLNEVPSLFHSTLSKIKSMKEETHDQLMKRVGELEAELERVRDEKSKEIEAKEAISEEREKERDRWEKRVQELEELLRDNVNYMENEPRNNHQDASKRFLNHFKNAGLQLRDPSIEEHLRNKSIEEQLHMEGRLRDGEVD